MTTQKHQRSSLLVYPPSQTFDDDVPPLGLLSIAAFANASMGRAVVEVLDLVHTPAEQVPAHLRQSLDGVRIVGMTVMSTDVIAAFDMAAEIKAAKPDVLLVAGGAHATLSPETFAEPDSNFDVVVLGEGEIPFLQILQRVGDEDPLKKLAELVTIPGVGYVRGHGLVINRHSVSTPISLWPNPFDIRPIGGADNQLFYTDAMGDRRKAVALVTSRSCPLNCHFCSIISMGTSYRSMSPEAGVAWLSEEMQRKPFEHIYFLDADFLVSKSRARSWACAINDKFPGVTWSAQANVGHIIALKDDLNYLRSCGLVFAELGIEAGNDRQLEAFNKTNFGKIAKVQHSHTAVKLLSQAHIDVGVDYIMFYPDLTLTELAQNLTFILEAGLIDNYDTGHYFNELMLFPGTKMREMYEERSPQPFNTKELPNIKGLYLDARVLAIRNAFLEVYSSKVNPQTEEVRSALRATAKKAILVSERAELRLTEILLRHQPYHVLKSMIVRPEATQDVIDAAITQNRAAERLCRPSTVAKVS